jgi:hypothetical protein
MMWTFTPHRALLAVIPLVFCCVPVVRADDCHPKVDPSKPQYIVGYGSLMDSASKRLTEPRAGINLPVSVTGFQRAWNTHGTFGITFLGVQPSKSAVMVAALYRSFLEDGQLPSDAREMSYCRAAVDPAAVTMLDGSKVPSPSQIWISVNKPETLAAPSAAYPIAQSYVDLFISGCIDLQSRLSRPDVAFVDQCVKTTAGWSKHWVNDRLYPRRPLAHEPGAWEIDGYLKRLLPEYFGDIRIE